MIKRVILAAGLIFAIFLSGCATVPMAPLEQDTALKKFSQPLPDKANLYIYRSSSFGSALTKKLYIDDELLGETAPKTYFFKEIEPGEHKIATQSEFGDNSITFQAESGRNYFCEQYIKLGVFVGGANLKMVSEEEGMKQVMKCGLAK